MKKIKSYLAVAGIVAIAVLGTYFIMNWKAESRVDYVRGEMQQQLDSLTVVKQAAVASRAAIEDSLESLDKEFAKYVTRTNQKISSYTTIIGKLRIQKDRLQDSTQKLQGRLALADLFTNSFVTGGVKDTLVSRTETWSDSLFATKAIAKFDNDSLYLESELRALRNPRIDVVQTVAEDGSQVNTFVRSSDFDSLNVKSVTEIKRKKSTFEKAAPYAAVAGIVLAIKQAINLIKTVF